MPTVVSLFSGCGGLDLGFRELDFEAIYACDSDPAAVDCYARNVDARVRLADVASDEFEADIVSLGGCDVVLGGFPCQGFSKAGPKKVGDPRNGLYLEMLKAIACLRPLLFIAENVDGLSQNFAGSYLTQIVNDFEKIGYKIEYQILDAAAFGVPQHRRRIFFVGVRQPSESRFEWPLPTHALKSRNGEFKLSESLGNGLEAMRTIEDAIADLIDLDDRIPDHQIIRTWPPKYQLIFKAIAPGQKLCNVRLGHTSVHTWKIPDVFGEVTPVEQFILETISRHRRHKKYGNKANGNPLPLNEIQQLTGLTQVHSEIVSLISKAYLQEKCGKYDLKGAMFCSGLFKRPQWHEPAPTVLTNFYNPRYFLHSLKDRPFSLRECARLQGFPDTFIFTDVDNQVNVMSGYRLVGNAVPPPLSRVFARAVLKFLKQM